MNGLVRLPKTVRSRRGDDMRCSPETLSAYVDGELSSSTRGRVHRHVIRCAACRRELEQLQALKELLRAVPTPSPPDRLVADITGHVRFREARKVRHRPRIRFLQGAFAGGLSTAFIVLLWMFGARFSGSDGQALAATFDAVVSEHSRHALLLETGADDWPNWYIARDADCDRC